MLLCFLGLTYDITLCWGHLSVSLKYRSSWLRQNLSFNVLWYSAILFFIIVFPLISLLFLVFCTVVFSPTGGQSIIGIQGRKTASYNRQGCSSYKNVKTFLEQPSLASSDSSETLTLWSFLRTKWSSSGHVFFFSCFGGGGRGYLFICSSSSKLNDTSCPCVGLLPVSTFTRKLHLLHLFC